MFVAYDAAKYRTLDDETFNQRREEVIDLLNAEELPEEVTTEQLLEERTLILAEDKRRSAAYELRQTKIQDVLNYRGASRESFAPAASKTEGEPAVVDPYDTVEYRKAFMAYAKTGFIAPELRADGKGTGTVTDIDINGAYTASDDVQIYVPTTLANRIIEKLEERGNIWSKVQKTYVKGGVAYNKFEFKPEAFWITQRQVSPYQMDEETEQISFMFHQLECRVAQTLLNAAVTYEQFQEKFAEAVANAMIDALETAVVSGTGNGQPLGFTKDASITNVVELTAAQVADWVAWHKEVKAAIPRAYRKHGEFIFAQGTWDKYIETLRDTDQHPVSQTGYNPVTGEEQLRLMGIPVDLVDDSIISDFDSAAAGDVIGVFGNLNDYLVNIQPGMPLSIIRWVDHDNNLVKTKALMACDGKVLDPYGFVLIKKKASA